MRCHQLKLNFMLTCVAANTSDELSGIARVACCASSSSDE
jgi:hypothetical protein